jgi:hypothetical protein
MTSDIIIRSADHSFRCYRNSMCSKCKLRFACFTTFKGRGGKTGSYNKEGEWLIVDGRVISRCEDNKPRMEKMITHMFGTSENFTFKVIPYGCDVLYKDEIVLEGAFKGK